MVMLHVQMADYITYAELVKVKKPWQSMLRKLCTTVVHFRLESAAVVRSLLLFFNTSQH